MKLNADFVRDWIEILKNTLSNEWGYSIADIADDKIPHFYFNAEQRRIAPIKRKVELSDTFNCPADLKRGWETLKNKIENGEDSTPNLSKFVDNINKKDPMLNDWGIHHFHLGENLEGKFIERTGPLLFALVTDNLFCAIGIFNHGKWADQNIVEILHKNWPELIKSHKIVGVELSNDFSERDRLALRKKHANAFVKISDGTVYSPIGGGSSSSGLNVQTTLKTDLQISRLNHLQDFLENELSNLKDELVQRGYKGEAGIEAKLEITEDMYRAIFPAYKYAVILHKKA